MAPSAEIEEDWRPPRVPHAPPAMRALLLLALFPLLAVAGLGFIQTEDVETPPVEDPHRQFDFWVGNWECRTPDGALGGTNEITLECGDKVLQEHWTGAQGGVGTSLNTYDARRKLWHQTWVDQYGTLLLLDGGLNEEGHMILEGTRPAADGTEIQHRIRWAPSDETVRQTWTVSRDGGAAWKTVADLIYSRVEKPAEESEGQAR